MLEKPFGRDSASCAAMIRELSFIPEEELYRIDHYLGKELVMNLLVLRFANVCFQAIANPNPNPNPSPNPSPNPNPNP